MAGEDLEDMMKANRQISAEEAQKMKDGALVVVDGQKRFIEEIVTRRSSSSPMSTKFHSRDLAHPKTSGCLVTI